VEEACRALAEHTFDIVLLDLNLNEQSGIPIAEAARDLPSPPVVLVVTGDLNYLDVERLEELGTRALMKMNLGAELVGMVRSVLDELRVATLPPRSEAKTRALGNIRKTRGVASLSAKESAFLERLEAGETLSVETVAHEALERRPDNVGNENAVQKFVSRLRAKLAALGVEDHVIACVYGGHYRSRRSGVVQSIREDIGAICLVGDQCRRSGILYMHLAEHLSEVIQFLGRRPTA
jgi:DNA-binding response OmpR family regulator